MTDEVVLNEFRAEPQNSSQPSLDDKLQFRKGFGLQAATLLAKLGIVTAHDLIRHIPRRWEDRSHFRHAPEVLNGEFVTLRGRIRAVNSSYPKPKMVVTKVPMRLPHSSVVLVAVE